MKCKTVHEYDSKMNFWRAWEYINCCIMNERKFVQMNWYTEVTKPPIKKKTKYRLFLSTFCNGVLSIYLLGRSNGQRELNPFRDKQFTGTCYADLNLIGLDWIKELDLFTVPLKSVFNTFSFESVQDTEKYFTQTLKSKFSDVFREDLGCCTKIKATLKLKADLNALCLMQLST